MIPIFALFDPATDASLEKFSVTIGGLAAAVWYIKQLVSKKPQQPPNRQLEIAAKDLERRVTLSEAAISGLKSEMASDRRAIDEQARTRSDKLYSHIDSVRRELSDAQLGLSEEMSRGFKDVERAIGRLEGTINAK